MEAVTEVLVAAKAGDIGGAARAAQLGSFLEHVVQAHRLWRPIVSGSSAEQWIDCGRQEGVLTAHAERLWAEAAVAKTPTATNEYFILNMRWTMKWQFFSGLTTSDQV